MLRPTAEWRSLKLVILVPIGPGVVSCICLDPDADERAEKKWNIRKLYVLSQKMENSQMYPNVSK